MVKWSTILIAVAGLALAVYAVATEGRTNLVPPPPASSPSVNPFAKGIAAAGTIEAASRNVSIASPEGGVVSDVFAKVGQSIKKGDPLFKLDSRVLEAELIRARASHDSAAARLARLRAAPRAEELPPVQAAVLRAKARLADAVDVFKDTQSAASSGAVSQMEIQRRRFAVDIASAELEQAESQVRLVQSGAWEPDVQVAQAELKQVEAEISAIELRLSRLTVRAPITGTILKQNIEPGQYAAAAATGVPAMILGDISTLRVRARIDEEDAPLLKDNSRAIARIRGVAAEDVPLKWMWIEPLAQGKLELTGSTTERVDTRVVEVVLEIPQMPRARLFAGQVVDVYIESVAGPSAEISPSATPKVSTSPTTSVAPPTAPSDARTPAAPKP